MSKNEKGIIIDGIDVSECSLSLYDHYDNSICLGFDGGYNVFCSDNPDCYYKQLQRTKAQYDEVVKQNKSLQAEREDYKELEKRHNEAFQDFEKLKSENKKLAKDNNVLAKTLKEIEEYINNFCDNCDWNETDIDCASSCRLDEITIPILEKIKEVGNE